MHARMDSIHFVLPADSEGRDCGGEGGPAGKGCMHAWTLFILFSLLTQRVGIVGEREDPQERDACTHGLRSFCCTTL